MQAQIVRPADERAGLMRQTGLNLGTAMNGPISLLMSAYVVLVAIVVIVGFPVLAPYVWLSEWRASRKG